MLDTRTLQDIRINREDLDGTAVFAHTILSKRWLSYYRNRIEYSDFYASFCVYYLTYRPKYDPSRGTPMAFTKICVWSFCNKYANALNTKRGKVREARYLSLEDVSDNLPLDDDERAIVEAWEARSQVRSIDGLVAITKRPEAEVRDILNGLVDKVAERRRVKKVVIN